MSVTEIRPLDLDRVREHFPALQRRVGEHAAVYLDGAGGSQTPAAVAEAMARYLLEANANTGGPFATSHDTDALIAQARDAAADLLGCRCEEIVFGANTTTINFLLAHAVARTFRPGEEIIVTELDHDANVAPWLLVAADHGLTVRQAPLRPEDGTLDLEAMERLCSQRTRLIACTLASNALGTVPDVARVGELARRAGALLWLDGVHLAPHRRLDFRTLGADVVLTSPYKYFGPHLGVAALREELARTLPADRVRPAEELPPGHRFETGTTSHEALAGLVAAVDYLAGLGDGESAGAGAGSESRRARLDAAFASIEAHEQALCEYALGRLGQMPALSLYGLSDPARARERTPTFCFNVTGRTPREVSEALGEQGIFVYDGNYYALGVMNALGLEESGGAVRAGFLHYTTMEEARRFCDAVEELARGR